MSYDPLTPDPDEYDDEPAAYDFRPHVQSLRDVWDVATVQPGMLEHIIYAGKLHSLTAPPEAGKTVTALHLAIAAMRRGRNVLWWDEEIGDTAAADLLQSMGAEPEMVDKHLRYVPFAGRDWRPSDCLGLRQLVAQEQIRLAIFDSSAAMLGAGGVNENDNGDVTRFWQHVWQPLARSEKAAVIVIDHEGRDGGASRYARGAGAKLAVVDVALKLAPIVPFTRTQDGLAQLLVTKDRPGWLHRYWRVKVKCSPLTVQLSKSNIGDLSPATRKVYEALASGQAMSQQQIGNVLADLEQPLKRETIVRSCQRLLDALLVDRFEQGGTVYWQRSGRTLDDVAAENRPAPPERPGNGWPEGSEGAAAND